MKHTWLLLASVILIAGCVEAHSPSEASLMADKGVKRPISQNEVSLLQKHAAQGSGEDAYELNMYYVATKQDAAEARYWLTIAAEDGYPPAMYALGLYLSNEVFPVKEMREPKLRGRYWLERARDAGYEKATDALKRLDQEQQ